MMKTIGFCGIQCEDIMVHFGKMLSLLGHGVALAPEKHSLSKCELQLVNGSQSEMTDLAEVDYLLMGTGFDVSMAYQCDEVVAVVDRCPMNAARLGEKLEKDKADCEPVLIVRDTIPQEYDDSYIRRILRFEKENISIPFSEDDLRLRCRIQNGFTYDIGEMSAEMQEAVIRLVEKVTEHGRAEAQAALRKERRGKWESLLLFGRRTVAVV